MQVLVAGASGMIGAALCRRLTEGGHTVLRLVRHDPRSDSEFHWAPAARIIDFTLMERVDAVIGLSGASLSHLPWTRRYKKQILDSRISATQTLTDAMRMASHGPKVFVSASAVGYYGDRPGVRLTEKSSRGSGFLADVVEAWEAAAHLAPEETRVVTARSGVVVGRGGAMKPLLPLARLGLAGPIGTGGQHWPWISLHDEIEAIIHLLDSELDGPVNLAGPTPATAAAFLRELATQVHRPYGLPLPEKVIDLTLRDAGHDLLLTSQKVVPEKLLGDGFQFADATARDAIARLLARVPAASAS
ncbi:TIGR01777 family protein [Diaminobutyricibacter tongyongensis]|uniref:TIGR01777 family protein n=1 Tax=Leifsonia tongyongensis TaxID=1268043 RepID=A0A6L9Y1T1_9MICO|nr:TIGR01777 family oxidoreductase [Diaminobutyricibacter tongyongensis]NEN07526.1 TIGR01777 family protein [Diaminobutyricibacter tongyongensis]